MKKRNIGWDWGVKGDFQLAHVRGGKGHISLGDRDLWSSGSTAFLFYNLFKRHLAACIRKPSPQHLSVSEPILYLSSNHPSIPLFCSPFY